MKKKVSEIFNTPYGQDNDSCEPSKQDIQKAIDEEDFETRGFQEHEPELKAEFEALNVPERYEWLGKYHAKRVAFFVVNGWDDPIELKKDAHTIKDGLHRLKAAIHLDIDEVEVKIEGQESE